MAKAPDLKLDELPDVVREVIEPHIVDSDAVLQEISASGRLSSATRRRLARHRVGRCDVRIGAVVHIQQRALRAFEEQVFAALVGLVKHARHVAGHGLGGPPVLGAGRGKCRIKRGVARVVEDGEQLARRRHRHPMTAGVWKRRWITRLSAAMTDS